MRNASGGSWCSRVALLHQVLGTQASPHGYGFGALHYQHRGLGDHDHASSSPGGMGGPAAAGAVMAPPPPPTTPLLFRGLASLNLLLLVGYLLLLLLAKLFALLLHHHRAKDHRSTSNWYDDRFDHRTEAAPTTMAADEEEAEYAAAGDVVVGGLQQVDTLFWFDEAVFQDSSTLQLLGDEGKDHHHPQHHLYGASATETAARCCLQVESNFPVEEESAGVDDVDAEAEPTTTQHVQQEEAKGDKAFAAAAVDGQTTTVPQEQERRSAPAAPVVVAVSVSPEEDAVSIEAGNKKQGSNRAGEDARHDGGDDDDDRAAEHEEESPPPQGKTKSFSEGQHDVKLFVNNRALADTRKLLLEAAGVVAGAGGRGGGGKGAHAAQVQDENADDKDSSRFGGGASTLTSASTSKSSVEWRSSAVTGKDCSETDYPFSSSSRRSSARWESYTLFRRYDEDMVYFHRVGAQKLTETESFRSIKYQPRSMSERIVRKLTPKPMAPAPAPPPIGLRDPYPELERAYVAQVCLTWEALSWNHASFRRHNGGGGGGDIAARCCPARVAQEFQQFQVLLHRFIENEPYECGRRPEVYARMKNSTPKLLLVPEFRDEEDEKDDLISAVQFLLILEESIRTFMAFLRADRRSHYEMFREMVKRRRASGAADQTLVVALKKANKKKKSRVKDLTRPRRCLRRTRVREEEELSILLGLIDLKVVARVLRMPDTTDQQLHWCEEKMNRVRIDLDGNMHRDPTPLFYPAH